MKIKRYIAFISFFAFVLMGCSESGLSINQISQEVVSQITAENRPYWEIVPSEIHPGIAPDYEFPKSYQYENGCFGFAIQFIVEHKFQQKIDMYQAEKIIKKPRYELWTLNYIEDFLDEYGINLNWYNDSETFFEFLENGEPLLMHYKYPVGENRWISHFVAAYSFDEEGVWISQSITNKYENIPYRHVFKPDGTTTQFMFATVESFDPENLTNESAATPNSN